MDGWIYLTGCGVTGLNAQNNWQIRFTLTTDRNGYKEQLKVVDLLSSNPLFAGAELKKPLPLVEMLIDVQRNK